jgi:hypothetical protein
LNGIFVGYIITLNWDGFALVLADIRVILKIASDGGTVILVFVAVFGLTFVPVRHFLFFNIMKKFYKLMLYMLVRTQ